MKNKKKEICRAVADLDRDDSSREMITIQVYHRGGTMKIEMNCFVKNRGGGASETGR